MFGFEDRAETLIFMSRHFDQKIGQNDHFDFAFSPFWCTEILTCEGNKSGNPKPSLGGLHLFFWNSPLHQLEI